MASFEGPVDPKIAEFLNSIPEIIDFKLGEEGQKPERDAIFHAIKNQVIEQFPPESRGDDHWISELAASDLDKESEGDEAGFLARHLTSYVIDHPWVCDREIMLRRLELVKETPPCIPKRVADPSFRTGMAGFCPKIEKDKEELTSAFSEEMPSQIEADFVNQYRSHVELAGTPTKGSARVSLLPRGQNSSQDSIIDGYMRAKNAMSNFLSEIRVLQRDYNCFHKLLFIRTLSSTMKSLADENSVEIASIRVTKVFEFTDALDRCKEFFEQSSGVSDNEGRFFFMYTESSKGKYMEFVNEKSSMKECIYKFCLRGSDLKFKRDLDPLMLALAPMLKTLRVDQFNWEQSSESTQSAFLHLTALVAQGLNLILQSYLRGSLAPFRFHVLMTPIYEFALEGTSRSPQAPKVYAASQELSCLGDMLDQKVLVFGLKTPRLGKRLDVIATPSQVDILWGPAVHVPTMRSSSPEEDEGSEDGNHGYYTDDEYTTISAIKLRDGIIFPTGEIVGGLSEWHWMSMDEAAESNIGPILSSETCVDFHTPIRIGARGGLRVTPIGPARWNKKCRKSADNENANSSVIEKPAAADRCAEVYDHTSEKPSSQSTKSSSPLSSPKEAKTLKEALLSGQKPFAVQMAEYDEMWGLFVSLCTGVMTRVRLRDLVAHACRYIPVKSPKLPGHTREASLEMIIEVLSGEQALSFWPKARVQEYERQGHNPGHLLEYLQDRIISIFHTVLYKLKNTGIATDGDLRIADLTQSNEKRMLVLPIRYHPWIEVLSDSSLTATFACASPHCFETPGHECQKDKWKFPKEYRLSTKLNSFSYYHRRPEESPGFLQVGERYRINDEDVDMMVTVDRVETDFGKDPVYFLSARKRRRGLLHSENAKKRGRLREDDSQYAINCIISGYDR